MRFVTICLELADPIGIERPLDFCPCAVWFREGPRVNDFFRCLPLPRKVEHELWLIGNRVRGLQYSIVSYTLRP